MQNKHQDTKNTRNTDMIDNNDIPKFNKNERDKFHLSLMRALLIQVEQVFLRFREKCWYRDGVGCDHQDYHEDFALANICKSENCPRIQEND